MAADDPASRQAPDPSSRRELGRRTYREVMTVDYDGAPGPYGDAGLLDFVFAGIWTRPGLSRRNRRWVTLACVGAEDTVEPIEANVYAALNSGDMSFEELQEFVLHFAVYCGWPKGSLMEGVLWAQRERLYADRGEVPPASPTLAVWQAGLDPEARLEAGAESFRTINLVPAPPRTSPYVLAGITNFVFGEVWQRPGLSVRDRRFITLACVGVDDTVVPIRSHVYSALKSGDVTIAEMQEVVLHFAAYSGWPKGSLLNQVVAESWARIEDEGGVIAPEDNTGR